MKLIIEDDEGRKTVVPIVRDEISIGRQEGNTIRLTERNVSRRHARLLKQNGAVYIEDLGSYNGVLVNGDKIGARQTVKEGDLIEIGDYDLALEGAPGATDGDTNPTAPNASGHLEAPKDKTPPMAVPVPPPAGRSATPAGGTTRKDSNATAVIRLSDIGRSDAAGEERDLAANETPRLVGLSGQFRGREFPLRRSVVKFGRTDEGNELVIDHQSISRTHGRFELEGGTWKVVDNKSANGVRVNGDEYGMSPVKPGDTLELGHVKFRFCAPGEAFAPPRETAASTASTASPDADEPPPAGRKRTGLFIGLGVGGLVVVAATAALLLRSGASGESDELCRKAQEALAAEKWPEAASKLQVLKNLEQKCEAIPSLDSELQRARIESEAKAALDEAQGFAESLKWKQAIAELKRVPAESKYAGEAKAKIAESRTEAVRELAAEASKLIEAGKLSEAKGHVDDIGALDPEAASIDLLSKAIDQKRKAIQEQNRVVEKPKKSLAERNAEATKLLAEGIGLVKASSYAAGVGKLRGCVDADPEVSLKGKCYRNMGIAYARDGKTDDAVKSYKAYLKEIPNAPERAQLLEMIRKYEGR